MRAARALSFGLLPWQYGSGSFAEKSLLALLSHTRKSSNLRVNIRDRSTDYQGFIYYEFIPLISIYLGLTNQSFAVLQGPGFDALSKSLTLQSVIFEYFILLGCLLQCIHSHFHHGKLCFQILLAILLKKSFPSTVAFLFGISSNYLQKSQTAIVANIKCTIF